MKRVLKFTAALGVTFLVIIGFAYVMHRIPEKHDISWLEESGISENDLYFPPASMHWFKQDWYGKHLDAAQEEPIWNKDLDHETYRFLWLRSFHKPVVLRVELVDGESGLVTAKVLSGKGGYEPGQVESVAERVLSSDDLKVLRKQLRKSRFWQRDRERDFSLTSLFVKEMGLDGAQWILEGKRGNIYHYMDRWTPSKGTYKELCLLLLETSEIEFEDVY